MGRKYCEKKLQRLEHTLEREGARMRACDYHQHQNEAARLRRGLRGAVRLTPRVSF